MSEGNSVHIPVLLQEVESYINARLGGAILDGTLGGGSYTRALSKQVGESGIIYAFDQDQVALDRFAKLYPGYTNVELHHANFRDFDTVVARHTLDGAVVDLGISSDQLADRERGISFQDSEAPLDMRMNASRDNKLTAWGILNSWEEHELADMIYHYGDETKSRRIARAIVAQRAQGKMETVGDLVRAIEGVSPRRGKIHPATRTFQALRIVVNDELGSVEDFLNKLPDYMTSGGRLVVVSFHSAEDRIVKHAMRAWKQAGKAAILTPKPIGPSTEELTRNPRARSAKLRTCTFN